MMRCLQLGVRTWGNLKFRIPGPRQFVNGIPRLPGVGKHRHPRPPRSGRVIRGIPPAAEPANTVCPQACDDAMWVGLPHHCCYPKKWELPPQHRGKPSVPPHGTPSSPLCYCFAEVDGGGQFTEYPLSSHYGYMYPLSPSPFRGPSQQKTAQQLQPKAASQTDAARPQLEADLTPYPMP